MLNDLGIGTMYKLAEAATGTIIAEIEMRLKTSSTPNAILTKIKREPALSVAVASLARRLGNDFSDK